MASNQPPSQTTKVAKKNHAKCPYKSKFTLTLIGPSNISPFPLSVCLNACSSPLKVNPSRPIQQTRCSQGCSINTFVISSLIHRSFCLESLRHYQSQTISAGELKFWENLHPLPCVTCHMSRVTCHMSSVRCHNFFIYFFLTMLWS